METLKLTISYLKQQAFLIMGAFNGLAVLIMIVCIVTDIYTESYLALLICCVSLALNALAAIGNLSIYIFQQNNKEEKRTNNENHYCSECLHHFVGHKEIGCAKGHSPTPILMGYTKCEDFDINKVLKDIKNKEE